MEQTTSSLMGGDLTAKQIIASVELMYAAETSDFYLRQNELVAIVTGEVEDN